MIRRMLNQRRSLQWRLIQSPSGLPPYLPLGEGSPAGLLLHPHPPPALILYLVSSPLYSSAWRTRQHRCSFLLCVCVSVCLLLFFPVQLTLYIDDPLSYKHINTPLLLCSTTGRDSARGLTQSCGCTVSQIADKVGRQEIFNLSLQHRFGLFFVGDFFYFDVFFKYFFLSFTGSHICRPQRRFLRRI